ncbi:MULTISPECIES: hypothetical protein [unclassified Nostoc]|nr:hypothetical protein [Nostoc sp. JL31]MBN3889593.1 hypothetical protein [Nostoc sp. JL31]
MVYFRHVVLVDKQAVRVFNSGVMLRGSDDELQELKAIALDIDTLSRTA